jgi:vitamin B12 transporter
MKKEEKVWAITSIALWWLAPNLTSAQQDSLKATPLSEVVVTATKFPKSQTETGKVLTVIDEAQLQQSSGKDLAQLLNEQVGLVINGANGNPGKDKSVFLRGAAGQYTVILLDGIPVHDPSGVGGAFDLRMLPVDQVERIEILKGSQSTLYGTDAIAGVVNIITKKNGDKPISGSGTLSYGSFNTLRGNASVSGSTRAVEYHGGYTYSKTDGISEAKDETGNNDFDKDGFSQNSVQLNLGVKPTEKFSVRPFVRYTNFDGRYDIGSFVDDRTAQYTSKLFNFGATGQYAFSTGAINFNYSRSNTERNFMDAFGSYQFAGNFDHAEAFANRDMGKNFQLLAGINYQKFHMKDENAVKRNPTISIVSPYVSFFLKNLKGVSAEVGGRFNHHSAFGNVFTYSVNPSYLIKKQVKLFANHSTGFKAPTLNELYGFGANDKLEPQQSKSADAGVQYLAADGKFDVRASYFNRKVKDLIFYGPNGYINHNEQNDLGFEIEPSVRINKRLSAKVFYAFVTGNISTKTPANRDTSFNNLLRRPKHSIGVNIAFQITKNFFANANLKTFGARDDRFFDFNDFSTTAVRLSAYQLLDLYAEYKLADSKVKLFVDAKNILNQNYTEVHGYNTLRFNLNMGVSFKL